MPKISVVTVNYNNAEGLLRTIKSVINQEISDLEYIVIDGHSTDRSKEVILENASHLDHWRSEPDSGVYEAMNKGIRLASGDYILFLNSGDVFNNRDVLKETIGMLTGEFDIYYGNLIFSNSGKEQLQQYPDKLDFDYFLERSLPHPGSFIRRSLFDRLFYYSEDYDIVSDWEFFVVAVIKEKVNYLHLDKVISKFELDGMSNNPQNKKHIEEERTRVIKHRFPDRLEAYQLWIEKKYPENKTLGNDANTGWLKKTKKWLRRFK